MRALVIGGTGPTGPMVVEGLIRRGYQITILHSGKHEVEFSSPVEHIHGSAHFPKALKAALGARAFDLVIAMYGRLRHIAEIVREEPAASSPQGACRMQPSLKGKGVGTQFRSSSARMRHSSGMAKPTGSPIS